MGKNCLLSKEISAVLAWFEESKRELPWRQTPTPYRVWISEVMLQQTQAVVVVPYFIRWMEQFPDAISLAHAPFEKVIKAWEGLGYYSRVRNLHAAAKKIVAKHGGLIPDNVEELSQLPGLGDYTINAILSFAFKKKALAVDANVIRVLARFFGVDSPIDQSHVRKELSRLGSAFLTCDTPWEVAEALIELGALVCNKNPQCLSCPLKSSCVAHRSHREHILPLKKSRPPTEQIVRNVAILTDGSRYLLRQNSERKLMQDLWEFPYFPIESSNSLEVDLQNLLGCSLQFTQDLPEIKHSFTRFRVVLKPTVWKVDSCHPIPDYHWIVYAELKHLALSSGHRKLLKKYADTLLPLE